MDESSYADSVTDASSIFSRELCSKSGTTFEDTMEIDDLAEIDVTGPYGPFSEVAAFRTGNITDSSIQEKDLNSNGGKFFIFNQSGHGGTNIPPIFKIALKIFFTSILSD